MRISNTPAREPYSTHHFRIEGIDSKVKAHNIAIQLEGLYGSEHVTLSQVQPSTSKELTYHIEPVEIKGTINV